MATVDGYGGKSEAEVSVTCMDTTCGLVEHSSVSWTVREHSTLASEDRRHGIEEVEGEEQQCVELM